MSPNRLLFGFAIPIAVGALFLLPRAAADPPVPSSSLDLSPYIVSLPTGQWSQVEAEADAQLSRGYAEYPSAGIEYTSFKTYLSFAPRQNAQEAQLAVFSDDGVRVKVNGQTALDNYGVGQHLPNKGQSLVKVDYDFEPGVLYEIEVWYSNIIYNLSGDLDGLTMIAYNGGATAQSLPGVKEVVSPPNIVRVGEELRLAAIPLPETATFPEGQPEWTVTPAATATLTPVTGRIVDFEATAVGDYTVTATCGDSSASRIVRVITIEIVSGGIATTDTIQETIVGKKLSLTVNIAPDDQAIERNFDWSFPGEYVRGYELERDAATIFPLTEALTRQQNQSLYWTEALSEGEVAVTVNYGPRLFTLKAKYNVASPTATVTSRTTRLSPAVDVRLVPTSTGDSRQLSFGHPAIDPGIYVEGVVSGVPTAGGEVAFVQLVDIVEVFTRVVGPPGTFKTDGYVVDDGLGSEFYEHDSVPSGRPPEATWSIGFYDSPGSPVFNTSQISRTDSFKTYLMFKPDGADSIWVTINRLTWNWSGNATNGATGWVVAPQQHAVDPSGEASSELPVWTNSYTGVQ